MRTRWFRWALSGVSLGLLLLGAVPATAATGVGGTITTTTWTKALSPYHVTGTITVPFGNALTIEPGVDVLFDADVQFVVQGAINAVGTATDSIGFIKGSAAEWGGLTLSGGDTSTLSYVRISHVSSNGGGGLDVESSSTVALSNCTITGNSARYGGGLGASSSTVTLASCTIAGNSAGDGGGLEAISSTVTLTNCTVTANSSSLDGGGLSAYFSALTLTNCTVTGNLASRGGGGLFAESSSTVTLTNCTITGNSASNYGGGLDAWRSTATLKNTILWGNTPTQQISVGMSASVAATYSDIQQSSGTYTGTGNINADPLSVNPANGDYRLQAGSPCIDAGDPTSPLELDGTRADMGASPYFRPVAVLEAPKASAFVLEQNFPNPFNPSTVIRFSLPGAGPVSLSIYDVNGRIVRTLVDETLRAGQHEVTWDGRDAAGHEVASGVYLVRLMTPAGTVVRRATLVR